MNIPFPKEHGVWAMLLTSLIIGFAVGGSVGFAGISVVLSLSLLLMAKAPLKSMLRSFEPVHLYWSIAYLLLSGLFLLPFLPLITPRLAILSAMVMLPAVPVYLAALFYKREMQITYEIPAMALLSLSASFSYTAAGGADTTTMFSLWLLGLLYYSASSFRVRSSPKSRTLNAGLIYYSILLLSICTAAALGLIPALAGLAFLPILENIWKTLRPRKEKISTLGRTELLKTIIFATFAIIGYRV